MTADELVGTDCGCMHIESAELIRIYGRRRTILYGHCINCGSPMRKSIGEINSHPPKYCIHCPKTFKLSHRDLSGQDYPAFHVIRRVGEYPGTKTKWLCICKICGRECEITQEKLSVYKSCGCLRDKANESGQQYYRNEIIRDGTNIACISPERQLNKNSTTGYTGVSKRADGRYRAYITYQKRQISLGVYSKLSDAISARRRGEEEYFQPVISEFEENGGKIIGKYEKKYPNRYETQNIKRRNGRYMVLFTSHGQSVFVGSFASLDEAIAARDKARAEHGMKPIK